MINFFCTLIVLLSSVLTLTACGGSSSSSEPVAPASTSEAVMDLKNSASLVRTFSIQNEICPEGGIEIEVGIDSNGNGLLDAVEVEPDHTQTICHGVDGSNGANHIENLLIDIINEPTGENCLHGGDVHRIGLDENEDGVLQEREVISVSFTCNDNGAPNIEFTSTQKNEVISGAEYLLLVSSTDDNNSVYGADDVELTILSKPDWLIIDSNENNKILLKGIVNGNIGDRYTVSARSTDGEKITNKEFIITVIESTTVIFSAINDLSGFSSTAVIDIAFSAALDPTTVVAGSSVWLVELKSMEDSSLIDSLNLSSIISAYPSIPFSEGNDQLSPGKDYVVEYIAMDSGATPSIRIHSTKPLDPKTKYIVIITDALKDVNGSSVNSSSEYNYLAGIEDLISPYLAPVRGAIHAWEQLAGGFLAIATDAKISQENVILSYAFTTEASTDVLLSMAAPENYIFGLFANAAALESRVGEDWINAVVVRAATVLNAANAERSDWIPLEPMTSKGRLSVRNTDIYKTALANSVAEYLIVNGADQSVVDEIKTANPTPDDYEKAIQASAANGVGAMLKAASRRPSAQNFIAIPNVQIAHDNSGLNLVNPYAVSMQGMLTLPQFMASKSLDRPASFNDFWEGSTSVGAVIDLIFEVELETTPAKDSDGSLNVSYRFPFAQYVEDVKAPVLITYPIAGSGCSKPEAGWKTIIFQHGFTGNRTQSLRFANSMSTASAGCFATVALDLPAHGIDAFSSIRNGVIRRNRLFNIFNVAGYVDGDKTPFSSTIMATVPMFEGIRERHNNVALDEAQQPIAMSFTLGEESGDSGDFFINLANMQQTRDHLRQATMDMMNLTASIASMDIDSDGVNDLDENNLYFVGSSLGASTGLTSVAVNNAVANNDSILEKDVKPFKAAIFASPGGQLSKLFENSVSLSGGVMSELTAKAGLTQGMSDLEEYFTIFQATLDSVDPINFSELLSETNTPVLMFEMVGGGLVDSKDSNTDPELGKVTGLSTSLIAMGTYPADTIVPNNANPALNNVPTSKSYLAGTDPLVAQLKLVTVIDSITPAAKNLMLVSKFKEGTHGTMSSADAVTVYSEMIGQVVSFFQAEGKGLVVGDVDQLQIPE